METVLWGINLVLLAALCLWAGRQDQNESGKDGRKGK